MNPALTSFYANSESRRFGNGGGSSDTPGQTATSPINVQLFPIAQAKGELAICLNGQAYGQLYRNGSIMNISGNWVQTLNTNAPDTTVQTRGFAFIPNCKMRAGSMAMYFRMVTGVSNFRYYLFKLNAGGAPELIAQTARFTPRLGLCVETLEQNPTIEADALYYMGFYCVDAGGNIRYLADFYNSDMNTSPLLTCADNNEVASIGSVIGGGTMTQYRPWMLINEGVV